MFYEIRCFYVSLFYFSVPPYLVIRFVLFKQKTAYEMRISDWSSDVCSSDLFLFARDRGLQFIARLRLAAFGERHRRAQRIGLRFGLFDLAARFLPLVGEHECREQQLASLGPARHRTDLFVDDRGQLDQLRFLPVGTMEVVRSEDDTS